MIRELTRGDIPDAAALVREHWDDGAARRASHQMAAAFGGTYSDPRFYVAIVDSQVTGMAGFRRSWLVPGAWEIVWVAVAKAHQSSGIGRALVGHGMNQIGREHGSLILTMTEHPRFFEKFGFKNCASFGSWHLLTMQLTAFRM